MMQCKVSGCEKPNYAAGYCSTHYNRLRKTGTTDAGPKARAPFEVRFWGKVDKRGPDECWNWTALRRIKGYGVIQIGGRGSKPILAHRAAWTLTNGPIPNGEGHHGTIVMHLCDNRLCCNPAHLRLGTQADNVHDMDAKGRRINDQPKGQKHGNAKLTDDLVRQIRASDKSNVWWARKLNMTRQAIRYARYNGWKHL